MLIRESFEVGAQSINKSTYCFRIDEINSPKGLYVNEAWWCPVHILRFKSGI